MAYVLGFFCADGSMFINPRGSKYISFYSTDKELVLKIRDILNSDNKLTVRKNSHKNWNKLFSLQIGSKRSYLDLLNLGLMPAKAKRLCLPDIPKKYLCHFTKGYFDGDGNVSCGYYKRRDRKTDVFYLMVRFTSGSKGFLESLSNRLSLAVGLRGGIAKNSNSYQLVYSKNDSSKLFNFMYNNVSNQEYPERKYNKFQEAFKIIGAVA